MRILIYIQDTEELWEAKSDYPLEKGELFSLSDYDGEYCMKRRWLEVVDIEKDTESGMTQYNTKIANVSWARKW